MKWTYRSNHSFDLILIALWLTSLQLRENIPSSFFLLSFYSILHFFFMQQSQLPFSLQSDPLTCSKSFLCETVYLLRIQEKQGGGTALLMLLKNIHKRMYLAVRKRAVGKSVLGHEEQKGTQRHWGHCWAREMKWAELVPGTHWQWEDLWQLLLGNPTIWDRIFCGAVQTVTVLVLD